MKTKFGTHGETFSNLYFIGMPHYKIFEFPLAPMGVPSAQPPIDTIGHFSAPVSAEWPSAFKMGLWPSKHQNGPSAFQWAFGPFVRLK